MDLHNLALRPNCLLTRYPLVFLNGPRSLFHFEKLGGVLQDYVAAHGYKVYCPSLPFRGLKLRQLALEQWLKSHDYKKFHFIAGEQTRKEFSETLKQYNDSTITRSEEFKNHFSENELKPTLFYKLHQAFCKIYGTQAESYQAIFPDKNVVLLERFLDRCIELAENE